LAGDHPFARFPITSNHRARQRGDDRRPGEAHRGVVPPKLQPVQGLFGEGPLDVEGAAAPVVFFGVARREFQVGRVQAGHHVPGFDRGALRNGQGRERSRQAGGQVDLGDFDRARVGEGVVTPDPPDGQDNQRRDGKDEKIFSFHGTSGALQRSIQANWVRISTVKRALWTRALRKVVLALSTSK